MRAALTSLYLAFLVSLPLRNVVLGEDAGALGRISPTQLLVLACFLLAGATTLLSPGRVSARYLLAAGFWIAALLVFCIFDILSGGMHDPREVASQTLRSRIATMMAFGLAFVAIRDEEDERRALKAVLVAAVIAALTIIATSFRIYDFTALGGRQSRFESVNLLGTALPRTSGILNDFGDIAILFAIGLASLTMSFLRGMRATSPALWLSLAAMAALLAGMIIPLSRNIWLTAAVAVVGSVGIFTLAFGARRRGVALLFAVAVAVGAPALLVISQDLLNTLLEMRVASSNARIRQYQEAIELVLDSPFFGVGAADCVIGGFAVHNMPLLAACRSGVGSLGVLALYTLLPAVLLYDLLGRRRPPEVRLTTASALAGLIAACLATMLFPSGAGGSSEICWGVFGLFAAMAARRMDAGSRARAAHAAARRPPAAPGPRRPHAPQPPPARDEAAAP